MILNIVFDSKALRYLILITRLWPRNIAEVAIALHMAATKGGNGKGQEPILINPDLDNEINLLC